jgi:transcriptional regulator with XRE-family HTH domain
MYINKLIILRSILKVMVDKEKFIDCLKVIIGSRKPVHFAKEIGVDAGHLSRLLSKNSTIVPSPQIIYKLADGNKDLYLELLTYAGHIPYDFNKKVKTINIYIDESNKEFKDELFIKEMLIELSRISEKLYQLNTGEIDPKKKEEEIAMISDSLFRISQISANSLYAISEQYNIDLNHVINVGNYLTQQEDQTKEI